MWWWLTACGTPPAEAPAREAPAPAPRVAPTEMGSNEQPRAFGSYPLCEPSAALPLDDGAFLVVDNEGRPADKKDGDDARPTLWVAAKADGSPVPVARDEVGQDAESVVRVGDELWVLGSLSRNKDCEVKGRRWEIHLGKPASFTAAGLARLETTRILERKKPEIAEIEGSVEGCQRILFGGIPEAGPVCAAIVEGAKGPEGRPCAALNVEGAAVVDGRVWVGLRAPVVAGKAVLARLGAAHDAIVFDAVREVDLGGLGVRELVVDGDRLYGIAGTELDATAGAKSKLFSVPVAGLASGTLPVEIHDPDLPASAESFLLHPDKVIYLLDGQSSSDAGDRCTEPARIVEHPR
jgi:hypothetical protein